MSKAVYGRSSDEIRFDLEQVALGVLAEFDNFGRKYRRDLINHNAVERLWYALENEIESWRLRWSIIQLITNGLAPLAESFEHKTLERLARELAEV